MDLEKVWLSIGCEILCYVLFHLLWSRFLIGEDIWQEMLRLQFEGLNVTQLASGMPHVVVKLIQDATCMLGSLPLQLVTYSTSHFTDLTWLPSVPLSLMVFLYPFWRLTLEAFQVADVLSGGIPS